MPTQVQPRPAAWKGLNVKRIIEDVEGRAAGAVGPFAALAESMVETDDELAAQIDKRDSSSLLNLDAVDVVMISGGVVSDGSSMHEIKSYGAYAEYGTSIKRKVATSSTFLIGEDARLMRNALHNLRYLGRGPIFTAGERVGLRTLSTDAPRAARLYSGVRLNLVEVMTVLRPLLFGTCPDLNSLIKRLPTGVRQPVMYIFNDVLRSMGNVFWCCNPWSGLCFLLAAYVTSSFQAIVMLVACVAGGLMGEALGAGRGMMALGLLQFNAIIAAQYIAYNHRRSPPFEAAWVETPPSLGVLGLVIVTSGFTTLATLVINPLVRGLKKPAPKAPAPKALSLSLIHTHGTRAQPTTCLVTG